MKPIFNFLPKAKVNICIPNEPEPSSVTIIGLNLIYSKYNFNSQCWNSLISACLIIWVFFLKYLSSHTKCKHSSLLHSLEENA